MTFCVNLFGGPGTGKSTTMAGTFSYLKQRGMNVEMAPEFMKEMVWEHGSPRIVEDQIAIFGEQHRRIWRLVDRVEAIITDSPLLLSRVYGQTSDAFKTMVLEEHRRMNPIDVFLVRKKAYVGAGRMQSESEARALDDAIFMALEDAKAEIVIVNADESAPERVGELVAQRILDKRPTKRDYDYSAD